MELEIGKKLKYAGSNKISKISKIEGDTVYFTDNSRAPKNIVQAQYHELTMSELITENAKPDNVQNIPNAQQGQPQQPQQPQQPDIDPNQAMVGSLGGLISQIEGIQKGTHTPPTSEELKQQQGYIPPIAPNPTGTPDTDYSGLSPETQYAIEKDRRLQMQKLQQKQNLSNIADNSYLFPDDNGGTVRKVDASVNQAYNENMDKYNRGDINRDELEELNGRNNISSASPVQRYEHNTKLPKMRKIKAIKLNLVLNERIPKLEDIRAVDSMFEDISLIEELGKEIASKYLNDPSLLEDMIISELEKKVKGSRRKKPVAKKKPVANKDD